MMAAMFATFILQVTIRYTARAEWIKEIFPFLDPTLYGWTLDFCLLMWIWMVFWGNGFIVRQRDHVIFDMLYTSVSPKLRKWLAIISALIISLTLIIVIEPTWSKFYILRLLFFFLLFEYLICSSDKVIPFTFALYFSARY